MTPSVTFSEHAVHRYIERVKPAHDRYSALRELRNLTASIGQITGQAPEWVRWPESVEAWLWLGDAVVFPVKPDGDGFKAVSCVVCSMRPSEREHRTKTKRRAARSEARRRARANRARGFVPERDRWA